jgi:hypothetical protein
MLISTSTAFQAETAHQRVMPRKGKDKEEALHGTKPI